MQQYRSSGEIRKKLKEINAELEERQQQLRAEAEQRVKLAADLQKYNNALDVRNDVQVAWDTKPWLFKNLDKTDWDIFDTIMSKYLGALSGDLLAEHGDLLDRLVGSEQQSA